MEILLAAAVFAVAIALLSLGTIAFRRPLKGSCGGVSSAMGKNADATCGVCGRSYADCPEDEAKKAETAGMRQ
jgi:hypothetical protein